MGEASGAGPARWAEVEGESRAWRAAHPNATLTEIEAAVVMVIISVMVHRE